MSKPLATDRAKRPAWRRWLTRLCIVAALLLAGVTAILAYRTYHMTKAVRRLAAVIAEIEQTDPQWRWKAVLAAREAVPEVQNSARVVEAAAKLLPKDWPKRPTVQPWEAVVAPAAEEPDFYQQLNDLPPACQLNEALRAALAAELKPLAPALAQARPLADLPNGMPAVQWAKNILATLLPQIIDARKVGFLLTLDATRKVDERKADEALVSLRAAVNAGRSVGDEPSGVIQLVRIGVVNSALDGLERVLAQGEPSAAALGKFQELLADEERQLPALAAMRGERVVLFEMLEPACTGEIPVDETGAAAPGPGSWTGNFRDWLIGRSRCRLIQAASLELGTRLVEIARQPPDQQDAALAKFDLRLDSAEGRSPYSATAVMAVEAQKRCLQSFLRYRVKLRCTQAAIAAERYRLAKHQWPDSLAQLVPAYLPRLPEDMYGGGPLRYRKEAGFRVIYSTGPANNNEEDIAAMPADDLAEGPLKYGFRLWDVGQRRQPPPKIPAPDSP